MLILFPWALPSGPSTTNITIQITIIICRSVCLPAWRANRLPTYLLACPPLIPSLASASINPCRSTYLPVYLPHACLPTPASLPGLCLHHSLPICVPAYPCLPPWPLPRSLLPIQPICVPACLHACLFLCLHGPCLLPSHPSFLTPSLPPSLNSYTFCERLLSIILGI